jgi:zinc transport system substrate-binding protein
MKRLLTATVAAAILTILAAAPSPAAAPRVVATIKPIHSLVAGVMTGVARPALLIEGASSPHAYHLRPSDARALAAADLVVRVGAAFETFLDRPLANLAGQARVLSLDQLPDMILLPARKGGVWEANAREPERIESGHAHDHAEFNLHLWLDPRNAQVIVRNLVVILGELDPPDAAVYRRNGAVLERRLADLDARLRRQLTPLRGVPYLVFHDAYPYLEHRYGLKPLGTITVSADRPPGAGRLAEIQARMEDTGARCVFSEPQFEPKLAALLVSGTSARLGILDPLGADLPPGPDAYFELMEHLADNLQRCLAPDS